MARKSRIVTNNVVKPQPITPVEAIDYALKSFANEIETYERHREHFLKDVAINVSTAVQWADSILKLHYAAQQLKPLVAAFNEKKSGQAVADFFLLKKFVDHVRDANRKALLNDYLRGASTSPSSNAVEHAHRAGASHLESVFEYVWYRITDAEKGLTVE